MHSKTVAAGSQRAAQRRALQAIAAFEAVKGIAAFAVVVGVVDLMHHDVRHLAMELIGHFGLDPDARYPSMLLHYADLMPGANIRTLVMLASGYIGVRMVEAYGLWNDRAWGEILGALSGALYVPFEIIHIAHRPTAIGATVLAVNIGVVGFLVFQLMRRRQNVHRDSDRAYAQRPSSVKETLP